MNDLDIFILEQKKQFAEDCAYFIRRKLDPSTEIVEEIEERTKGAREYSYSPINLSLYAFRENFLKAKGKNMVSCSLEDFRQEALEYLENSFPFCFNIDLSDIHMMRKDSFRVALAFYAMCLGASEEQLKEMETILQSERTLEFGETGIINYQGDPFKRKINIDKIKGSAVDNYQGSNLYDILLKINDKNASRYIEYIMRNGGLKESSVFNGICLYETEENDIFVSEGNHRILTYKVLKIIREYITGEKINGMTIEATIQRVKLQDRGDEPR